MWLAAPEMSADQVLTAFHHDAPYLFLGGAFVAVGIVSAAFAALRRRHDSLLVYSRCSPFLRGSPVGPVSIVGDDHSRSTFYERLRAGINYIILIPAPSCSSSH